MITRSWAWRRGADVLARAAVRGVEMAALVAEVRGREAMVVMVVRREEEWW